MAELGNSQSIADDEIDLLKLWGSIKDQQRFIAIVTSLFLIIGVAYAVLAPQSFTADALIQIEDQGSGIPLSDDMSAFFGGGDSNAATEIELIKSRNVLLQVVDDLSLDVNISIQKFPILGHWIERSNNPITNFLHSSFDWINGYAGNSDELVIYTPDNIRTETTKIFTGVFTSDTQFSIIDPLGASVVEDVVGNQFDLAGYSFSIGGVGLRQGLRFSIVLSPELSSITKLRSQLSVSEKGKRTGILSLTMTGGYGDDIALKLNKVMELYAEQNRRRLAEEADKSLQFIEQQLPISRSKLDSAESRLNSFQRSTDSIDLSFETEALLTQLVETESALNELKLADAELSNRYTDNHPERLALRLKKSNLLKIQDDLSEKTQALPETQKQLLALVRDVEVATLIYTQLLNKSQEIAIIKAGTVGSVRIIDAALDNPSPIKPKKPLIVALAFILGLLVSCGYVVIKSALRRGVENAAVIESELSTSVLATVPLSEFIKSDKSSKEFLLAERAPEDLSIEALRGLRTNLHFSMLDSKNSVIAISGASPGVGKSFVASNLAFTLAQNNLKVIVVDADLRKGHIHRTFNLDRASGLSDVLSGKCGWSDVIHKEVATGLDFLATGQTPPNPSELLARQQFKHLIKELDEAYDIVIIDTPPILAVTDASIIAQEAGLCLMVARYGVNPIQELAAAHSKFEQSGCTIDGYVLNAVERSMGEYNYNYSYEYR